MDWKDTNGLEDFKNSDGSDNKSDDKKDIEKTKIFEDFANMDDVKETEPVLIYFYWPSEDLSDDKNITNQMRRCKLMEENILSSEDFRREAAKFHCYKCDNKTLDDVLKKKYKVKLAPKVLFFDVKGKKLWQLTSTSAKPARVAKKMRSIVARCERMLKNKK